MNQPINRRQHPRRGSILVEFALIALVMYLLIAGVVELGRLLHGAQTLQSAADLAAREISRIPMSPSLGTLDAALTEGGSSMTYGELSTNSISAVYSEDYLAIAIPSGTAIYAYLASLNPPVPPVNVALLPLMFADTVGGQSLLRFPGALVTSTTAPSGYTVMVPVVTSTPGIAPETIEWHRVLEPVYSQDGSGSTSGPFSIAYAPSSSGVTSTTLSGIVALRLNYPFQAATMSGFQPPQVDGNGETLPNLGTIMAADDGGVTTANSVPNGGTPVAPDPPSSDEYSGPYGGEYGLGQQGSMLSVVRPFRKVISAQAIYRREVFSP